MTTNTDASRELHLYIRFSSASFFNQIISKLYLHYMYIYTRFPNLIKSGFQLISLFIIPHVNFQYKASIDERRIFYNITRCNSDGEYCHVFAIAAGDIIKYQGGHMMRNVDARTVR